ncbi:vegetative cell wall protein gp1-like [Manihot esculenta]|uniref:vegetative cell wall protein gp1-like n=1 Tax=Manihot esculenta TaxID=3983 RepID=UPI001CC58083|nr:vegetative cell wall protein gp1-like [Manihot esculenta]
MVRIKMKATGGPFMWKKLGLPRPPSPSDSDDETWDAPLVHTSTETPLAMGTASGRTDSPAAQTYRWQKKRPRTPIAPTTNPADETPPEATTSSGHGKKRPRTPSPPSPSHPEQETETAIAIHPAGHKESGAPSDLPTDTPNTMPSNVPSAMPRNVPTDAPSDLPTDLPADLPTDAPSDMPSDLPSDLPRPTCPDHITQALQFNKISEQTGLAKISSLPYHPGKYIHHGTLRALRLQNQEFSNAMGCECPQSTWDFPAEFNPSSAYLELSPVTPRHERVFRRKKANNTTTQQPASITVLADGRT